MQLSGGRGNIIDKAALDDALIQRIAEEEGEEEGDVGEFNGGGGQLPQHLWDPNMRK